MNYEVISDDYSDHNLPIGAVVTKVEAPEWADGGDWYSQGGDGDEVAIDPRDLRVAGDETRIEVPALEFFRIRDWQNWEAGQEVKWIDQIFEILDEMPETYKRYQVQWEPAKKGDWELKRGEIPKRCYERLHHVTENDLDLNRDCGYGPVTVLKHQGKVWMSDTRAEILEHAPILNRLWWSEGLEDVTVLINGLGLGMAVKAALVHGAAHIDVVEIDQDVIDIIGPNFAKEIAEGRVTIHHADALTITWPAGKTWTLAWHDIWPSISEDNLASMTWLHKTYEDSVEWQDSWQRAGCEAMAKKAEQFAQALERQDWNLVKQLDPEF